MASLFDKFKQMVFGHSILTPRVLQSHIIENFKEGKKGSSLLHHVYYPTSFIIFLESSDFERLKQHFPGIFSDTVDEFVRLLANEISDRNYIPHSRKWRFQFIKVTEGMLFQGNAINLPSGNVLIVSTLYPKGEEPKGTNTVVVTRTKDGTMGRSFEINPELLNDISEKGEFIYERKLIVIPQGGGNDSNVGMQKPSKASLTFISNGTFIGGMKSIGLFEPKVMVCGKSGIPGAGIQIVHMDDVLVNNPHFIIYENTYDGTFTIEAKAGLTLNGKNITGSSEMLPDGSLIVVANKYQLRFSVIQKNTEGNFFSMLISKIFSK